ncbi:MAG: hypothetical protein ACHQ7N_11810 [Candidatus Methylomirabilales bacterium]
MRYSNDLAAFAPPLIVTFKKIDDMVDILGKSIAAAYQEFLRGRW